MGKKCIPGVICVENMTLFMLIIIVIILLYIFMRMTNKTDTSSTAPTTIQFINPFPSSFSSNSLALTPDQSNINPVLGGISSNANLSNPYIPPVKSDVVGVSYSTNFQQKGILTQSGGNGLVLPFMGRVTPRNRQKWQYYTMSTLGNMNTKLPVRYRGKDCMNEYGCDEFMTGDIVNVDGFGEPFNITIYENSTLPYNPFV
jgi:hypothetical protein